MAARIPSNGLYGAMGASELPASGTPASSSEREAGGGASRGEGGQLLGRVMQVAGADRAVAAQARGVGRAGMQQQAGAAHPRGAGGEQADAGQRLEEPSASGAAAAAIREELE